MGAALGVAPERAGLMMSLFMLGFAVAPLFYGPVSDRYGAKTGRGVRLHAVCHRRNRLRLCTVAASVAGMALRAGAGAGASMTTDRGVWRIWVPSMLCCWRE
jgi:DHA1 family bicyclomycin/chloramphenicol resistance-like MFS transporter